ncbi:hypothetical protein HY491_00145 [Candidatus Woesearchaeota archaeon]|nr:hypothetical protein [Candidatus Woesearchaeota archaeon]
MASLFGMQAYGIEMDESLVSIAQKAADDLVERFVIPRRFVVAHGDFNDGASYQRLGAGLSEMDLLFHSINSLSIVPFFQRFAGEGKASARLVLLGGKYVAEMYSEDVAEVGLQISAVRRVEGPTRAFGYYTIITHLPHGGAAPSAHS